MSKKAKRHYVCSGGGALPQHVRCSRTSASCSAHSFQQLSMRWTQLSRWSIRLQTSRFPTHSWVSPPCRTLNGDPAAPQGDKHVPSGTNKESVKDISLTHLSESHFYSFLSFNSLTQTTDACSHGCSPVVILSAYLLSSSSFFQMYLIVYTNIFRFSFKTWKHYNYSMHSFPHHITLSFVILSYWVGSLLRKPSGEPS